MEAFVGHEDIEPVVRVGVCGPCLVLMMNNIFVIFLSIFFKSVLCDLTLPLPPRYMWGWGPGLSGYCGEMSTQVNPISSHLHTVLFSSKK